MAIIVRVVLRGATQEQYDRVRADANWLGEAPIGGLGHFTWWEGEDNFNVDAWESEAAFNAFVQDRLGPAMARQGVNIMPEVTMFPAHEVFTPKAVTITG